MDYFHFTVFVSYPGYTTLQVFFPGELWSLCGLINKHKWRLAILTPCHCRVGTQEWMAGFQTTIYWIFWLWSNLANKLHKSQISLICASPGFAVGAIFPLCGGCHEKQHEDMSSELSLQRPSGLKQIKQIKKGTHPIKSSSPMGNHPAL